MEMGQEQMLQDTNQTIAFMQQGFVKWKSILYIDSDKLWVSHSYWGGQSSYEYLVNINQHEEK